MIKNRYVGRTFIQPSQELREQGVKMKLSAVRGVVEGKRVVMIDDSIVRGTTSRRIVKMLREAGATEVHVRISSPPIKNPCFYGIDTSTSGELIAANHSVEEMREMMGADSLAFLSVEGLIKGIGRPDDEPNCGQCLACFTGKYPTEIYPDTLHPHAKVLEEKGARRMSEAYKQAGVSLEAGYEAVETNEETCQPNKACRSDGWHSVDLAECLICHALNLKEPVLVSGTDGVGTKLMLAFMLDRHDTIGVDAVAMCVNDIVVQGAEPLYFLDYIACGKAVPERLEAIVKGVADGCEQAGCALVGGETAEMPGMYSEDEYDLAGFSVGAVEKKQLVNGEKIQAGDVVIGLSSSGLHSNGFSLVRKILLHDHDFLFK